MDAEVMAAKLAEKMATSARMLAAATVNAAIGEKVLELLATQETISFSAMISTFQAVIDGRAEYSGRDLLSMQAEECITALLAARKLRAETQPEASAP
ncbi:MAG: hypothetical protein Q7R40_17050 [Phaeospirillum sp.]|nr:hypothetical protein [Phaeospirillum sp.]